MMRHLVREWRFLLGQNNVVILLCLCCALSSFAIYSGHQEIVAQHFTIERLQLAQQQDQQDILAKHKTPGSLAYYQFHLTYQTPSHLSFAALGDRDLYPWKHRIRMLALEGQIYESDVANPELAYIGKFDFSFLISVLAPLFVILMLHDIIANERNKGRYELLVVTASGSVVLWGYKTLVRFLALSLSMLAPFYIGSALNDVPLYDVLHVSILVLAYLAFWAALTLWFGRQSIFAPRIAAILIGFWVAVTCVIPITGNLLIEKNIEVPKGSEILLLQREIVNQAWDIPAETSLTEFVKTHPEYRVYTEMSEGFHWKWYYAFQQLGDQAVAHLAFDYRNAILTKFDLGGYIAMFAPPVLMRRQLSRMAQTDVISALRYEQSIRDFHQALRLYYYPYLFELHLFDESTLADMPQYSDFARL
jgi:ABC-2 type transport system permease protein